MNDDQPRTVRGQHRGKLRGADVGALERRNGGVVPQASVELIAADIHGIDVRRAVLAHTVGKAAGGRADIDTHRAVEPTPVQHLFQLIAAAADIARRGGAADDLVRRTDAGGRLADRAAVDRHRPGSEQLLRPLPPGGKAAAHQQRIQPQILSCGDLPVIRHRYPHPSGRRAAVR